MNLLTEIKEAVWNQQPVAYWKLGALILTGALTTGYDVHITNAWTAVEKQGSPLLAGILQGFIGGSVVFTLENLKGSRRSGRQIKV